MEIFLLYFSFVCLFFALMIKLDWNLEVVILVCLLGAVLAVVAYLEGWTNQERAATYQAKRAEATKPYLVTENLPNGCTLNYWYGYGKGDKYTAKFVGCPNPVTTIEEKKR